MQRALFVAAKLGRVALGLLIAYQAHRGYRRNGAAEMLYVAVGFVLISVGGVLEGLLFELRSVSIFEAGFVATLVIATGMGTVLYALSAPTG